MNDDTITYRPKQVEYRPILVDSFKSRISNLTTSAIMYRDNVPFKDPEKMMFYRYILKNDVLIEQIYVLDKETPQGYWIVPYCSRMHGGTYYYKGSQYNWTDDHMKARTWIPKSSRIRHAYPEKKMAINSLLIRKRKYIGHLINRILSTQTLIDCIKHHEKEILEEGMLPVISVYSPMALFDY